MRTCKERTRDDTGLDTPESVTASLFEEFRSCVPPPDPPPDRNARCNPKAVRDVTLAAEVNAATIPVVIADGRERKRMVPSCAKTVLSII